MRRTRNPAAGRRAGRASAACALLLAALLLGLGTAVGASDAEGLASPDPGPQASFAAFASALGAGDAPRARALLDPAALERCETARASKRPRAELPSAERVLVTALRRYESHERRELSCEGLLRQIAASAPTSGVDPGWFSLGGSSSDASTARAPLLIGGLPSGLDLSFRRDGTAWRLDPWPTLAAVGAMVELGSSLMGIDYERALDWTAQTLQGQLARARESTPK